MKTLLVIIFSVFCLSLMANLVENKPFEHTQPDGKVLNLLVSGDEYYHRVHDENGFTILQHPDTGFAVYAIPDMNTIKASEYIVGTIEPSTLGIEPNLFKNSEQAERRWRDQLTNSRNTRTSPVGTLDNVVCFVRFNDQSEFPTTPNFTWYSNLFNSTSQQSLADYYDEVSNGQLDINTFLYSSSGGFVLSIQVSHDRGYYSPYNATTNPIGYTSETQMNSRHSALIGELCGLADPLVPAGVDMDRDDDGKNDALTFIIRGATDGWSDLLWPAHWSWSGSMGTINGVEVWHYIFDFEGGLDASVVCHEMGHNIGFPDLYHYSHDGLNPVRQWSLMATDNTQHELVYEKLKYGTWLTSIPTITPSSVPTQYTLTAIDQNPYAAYKIASNYANQFYVMEYRRDTGRYESGIPGSGLIVYRVIDYYPLAGGSDIRGNADGPPDELYVYRPNGDLDTDGSYNLANFSSTVGRTEIHNYANPEPWIFVNTTTQVDGNLVITDVGASGGTTITFTVSNNPPNVWNGSSSVAWATSANWSKNLVPNSSDYVIIPAGMPRYPLVTSTHTVKHLEIENGANITINIGTLTITSDFENYGTLNMNNDAGNLWVQGDMYFRSGSSANITASSSEIYIQGDLELHPGSSVNMTMGYMEFYGSGTSWIRTYTPSAINNFRCNKDDTYYSSFSNLSTSTLTINGTVYVYNGSNAQNAYSGTLIIKGYINVYAGGMLRFNSGTVSMEGSSTSYINFVDTGNYFNNFTINKSGGYSAALSSDITVNVDVTISNGVFSPGGWSVTVKGNWNNLVGPTAFNEGTSRVIFNGAGHQYCNYDENFNILEVNNGAALRVSSSTADVTCAVYDWTAGAIDILEGTFTVNDLADSDNALMGGWYCNTGGTINIYNPAPYSFIDLKGDLFIYGGNFNVYGGSVASVWPYNHDGSITMTNGYLNFLDQGVTVASSFAFTENITGGYIRVAKDFKIQRADFTPSGGVIEFNGSTDEEIYMVPGANFYHVKINKYAARSDNSGLSAFETDRFGRTEPITRTNQITATSNLVILGNFIIDSGTFVAPGDMQVGWGWYNFVNETAFVEGTGTVSFIGSTSAPCHGETFNNLILAKGGGAAINFPDGNTICNTYDWSDGGMTVDGGTFTALDMIDDAILGTITLSSGEIHFHQTTDQYLDLRADLDISGGEMHLYGINGNTYWPYLGDASLTMSNGLIEVHDTGIRIHGSYTFTTNITGGVIRTAGDFYCYRADFTPTAGTIEMYSTADAYVHMSSGTLYNLEINKGARDGRAENQIRSESERRDRDGNPIIVTRSNTVFISGNLTCTNNLIIQTGTFNLQSFTAYVEDDLIIYGTLTMDNAADHLVVTDNIYWYATAVSQVSLGTIDCTGSWLAYVGANVVIPSTNTTNLLSTGIETIYLAAVGHQFGNLNINGAGGATYNTHSANTQPLIVAGNLAVTAGNELDIQYSDLDLTGALDLDGKLDVHTQDATIQGKPDFAATSELNITSGTFTFYDSSVPRTTYLRGNLIIDSGTFDAVNNGITINSGSETLMNSGIIRCDGINATVVGTFQPVGGTVEFTSNVAGAWYSLNITNGNYVPNLIVNTATGIILANNLSIHGNFWLQSGNFDVSTSNYSLFVTGDWQNDSGETYFNERSGMVNFSSSGDQTIITSETFYNFNLDNSSAFWEAFELDSGNTLTVLNDLQISDGTLEMNMNSVITTHNLIISANAGLNAYGDTNLMINVSGNWTDYNTSYDSWIGFYPGTSTVTFNGSTLSEAGTNMSNLEFYNLIVNKPVTVNLNLYDPVIVRGDLTITGGDWNDISSSFVHQVYGNVLVQVNGAWMSNSQNTLMMKGTGDTSITYNGSGGYFYNVTIDKTGSRDYLLNDDGEASIAIQPEPTRTMEVTLQTDILLLGLGNLLVDEGVLNINGNYIRCTGDVTVNAGGTLNIDDNAWLEVGNGYDLTVNNGGRLSVIGSAGNEAKVTKYAGSYLFNIETGGTIAARYAIFEYMEAAGVNVKSGAFIDASYPFDYCIFRNGYNGGRLLTLDNSETHTIANAYFPPNTWGGSYNAYKSNTVGVITFIDATGDFSGENYDYDPNNLINWEISSDVDLEIQLADWLNTTHYVGDNDDMVVTIVNNGTTDISTPVYLDLYLNPVSPPIPGEIGDFYIEINSVPPGTPLVINIPAYYFTEGISSSWLQIDTDENVDETDEGNNVYGPVNSTWQALPAITDLNIELVNPDIAHLTWNYPMSVTRFNVYKAVESDFIPGPSNLVVRPDSDLMEYSETAGGIHYFYIVTAERLLVFREDTNNGRIRTRR